MTEAAHQNDERRHSESYDSPRPSGARVRSRAFPQEGDAIVREGDVLAGKYRIERITTDRDTGIRARAIHSELGRPVLLRTLSLAASRRADRVSAFLGD